VEITLLYGSPEGLRLNVVVVGAFADGTLSPPAQAIDKVSQGKLSSLIERGDLDERAGDSLMLHDLPGTAAERVLLVSLGKCDEFGDKAFRAALGSAAKALAGGAAKDAAVLLADHQYHCSGHDHHWALCQRRRTRGRTVPVRYRFGRPRLAAAAVGGVPGSAQEQLRRHEQHRRALRRGDHRGLLPRPLRQGVQVGTPGRRRHRLGVGRRQGLNRSASSTAIRIPDPARRRQGGPSTETARDGTWT